MYGADPAPTSSPRSDGAMPPFATSPSQTGRMALRAVAASAKLPGTGSIRIDPMSTSAALDPMRAPMRSPSRRSRFHIRPEDIGRHKSSRLPRHDSHPQHSHSNNIATDAVAASGSARLTTGRNTNVKLVEPPSCSSASAIVFIGKNSRGQVGRPGTERSVWRPVRQPRGSRQICAVRERPSSRNHRRTAREIELDMGDTAPPITPRQPYASRRVA